MTIGLGSPLPSPAPSPPPQCEASWRADLIRPALAFGAAALVYLTVALLIGRFPVTDEVFYKSAGRQWAAGRGFGAPELEGALNVSPAVTEVFFLHPPLYPFSFGVWTRLVGFGARQCMAFDALIHLLLCGLTFGLAWRAMSSLGRARGWLAAAAAVLMLPLGTSGRPDELAMSFGIVALFLLLAPRARAAHLAGAGAALGFCLGTSVGAAVGVGLIAITIVVQRADDRATALRGCALLAVGGLLGVAMALGPLLAAHPGAPRQYLAHARFLAGHVSIWTAWADSRPHAIKYYTFLIGTLASGLLAATLIGTRAAWRCWARYGVGTFLYLLFLGRFLALRNTYTWFIGPWILVAALHLIFLLATTPGKRKQVVWPAALLVAAHLSFAVHFVKQAIVVATLPRAQRLDTAAARLRTVIPAGATVLTKDLWWFLAERNRTYEPMFAHVPEGAIDYVALTGNGSGVPGKPVALDPKAWPASFTDRMVVLSNDLPHEPTELFHLRITNSAYGFGSIVYRLTRPAAPSGQ